MTTPKVALAHDWLVGMRGGERVLDRIAGLVGPTHLYVMVADGTPHSQAIDACRVHTSWLQRLPGAAQREGGARRWCLPLYPLAVRMLTVDPEIDLLISTSSAFISSIRPPVNPRTGRSVPHLSYCHTPPRYLFEQHGDYQGALLRLGLKATGPFLRRSLRLGARRVTQFIANSSHTAARIQRAYGRDSRIIHPPVRTDFFTPDPEVSRDDFLLVAGALESYKRFDLAIAAAISLKRTLLIAGTGSDEPRLRALAAGHALVQFTGRVSDEELRHLFRRARMLLFPGMEDFGILPIEAMACGCPVAAYHAGGARDWLTPQVGNGMSVQSAHALMEAIADIDSRLSEFDPAAMHQHAQQFSAQRFDGAILDLIRTFAA